MQTVGTVTALVTPFKQNNLDEQGLVLNIEQQMHAGVEGLLVLGTTGEAATLTTEEQERVITLAVKTAAGRIPIWVGTGSYGTQHTLTKTQRAHALGADVALIVTPYYTKPTQEGIFRHFEAVAAAVDIPIVVYNIPSRTGTNIETQTLLRIASLPSIIGVKECSGSITQGADVIHTVVGTYPQFTVWAGDDAMTLPLMALGAKGVISVISNLVPQDVVALVRAMLAGDLALARSLYYKLLPLCNVAFIETNPAPIKAAMQLCGLPAGGCRLPLVPLMSSNLTLLRQQLQQMLLLPS